MKTKVTLLLVAAICLTFIMATIQQNPFKAPASADNNLNPLKGHSEYAAAGKQVFEQNCIVCHGAKGKGDGVAVAGLKKTPADLSSAAVQSQSDGAIYWKIESGNIPMPSYKATLQPLQIWSVVNYVRSLSKQK